MAPDQFLEQLNIAEAAADVSMGEFMQNHLRKYHAVQLTTNQKLVAAGLMLGVAAAATAATPQGRKAVKSAVVKGRIKLARFLAPKSSEVVSKKEFGDFLDI